MKRRRYDGFKGILSIKFPPFFLFDVCSKYKRNSAVDEEVFRFVIRVANILIGVTA